jgi:hypothetical protein
MLVRALKVLRFSKKRTKPRTDTATAALISRAMKRALIKEQYGSGNNEPSKL